MRHLILIVHNVRSAHNVGSLLRTADGLGVDRVYLTGYTPYPKIKNDQRLPHESLKVHRKIAKTALGAETKGFIIHAEDIIKVFDELKSDGFEIAALEQNIKSKKLPDYNPSQKIALLIGRETKGIETELLAICDDILEIPMFGDKESFNVVQAAAMALYHLRFT